MTASPRAAYLQQGRPPGGVAEPAVRPMHPKRLWPLCVLSPNYRRSTTFQVRSEPAAGVQLCDNLQSRQAGASPSADLRASHFSSAV